MVAGGSICGDVGDGWPVSRLSSKRKGVDQDQDQDGIPQSCRPGFKGAPSGEDDDDEKDFRSDLGYIRQRNVRNGF